MRCECRHERMGLCTRYPKVNTVVLGKTVWAFPPADCECGEKSPRTPEKGKNAPKPVKRRKPASDGESGASDAK